MSTDRLHESITTVPIPTRQDRYVQSEFNEFTNPELVELALRVHAEGYTTMGFVSEDAVKPDGTLDDAVDHSRGEYTDYFLAINPDNPKDIATMRKINIPPDGTVQDLPAYQLTKNGLYEEGLIFLNNVDTSKVNEIAGLARTKEAPASAVYELLRSAFQSSLGKEEVWFFSIVSSTYESLTKYFGEHAFTVIGEDVKIDDSRVNDNIQLRPTILTVDKLFESMIYDIENLENKRDRRKVLGMFLYFTEGLRPEEAGEQAMSYRKSILDFLSSLEQ